MFWGSLFSDFFNFKYKPGKTYVRWEYNPENEEFDEELDLKVLQDDSLLSYEFDNIGWHDEYWKEFFRKLPSGYYEIHYESDMEQERCDGHLVSEYLVLVEFTKALPSKKAWFMDMVQTYVNPKLHFLRCLFTKCWEVRFEYGGIGIGTPAYYLPKALWFRFVKPNPSWGPGWTKIYLSHY